VATRRDVEKKAELPLALNDPKIISIFVAWLILLGSASLIFLAEYVIWAWAISTSS
jgi:hypothetical protein